MPLDNLLAAVALMLVFEGILPFVSPPKFKEWLGLMLKTPDQTVRWFALGAMLTGVALWYLVH